MKAIIANIGNEILFGSVLNTNANYLTNKLTELNYDVVNHTVLKDNREEIINFLDNNLENTDLIIFTGGLGPTQDDLTKFTIADYFNQNLISNEELEEDLKKWFKDHNLELTPNNLRQALIPERAQYIYNPYGTAPGIIFEESNKIIILLPGPPREMKNMFEESVIDYLKKNSKQLSESKFYGITGIGESILEDRILDLIAKEDIDIATYAKPGEILLRVTAIDENHSVRNRKLEYYENIIRSRLEKNIFTYSKASLIETVANYLIDNNITISSAESCTGGLISTNLTNIPGISKVFYLGLVTYANEAKEKVLGVKKETLEKFGAVSEETCTEMCQNVRKILNTDIGVATTGIAGPGGGTKEKPVGLVYTGIAFKDKTVIVKNYFSGTREDIRIRTVNKVFQMIREELFTSY